MINLHYKTVWQWNTRLMFADDGLMYIYVDILWVPHLGFLTAAGRARKRAAHSLSAGHWPLCLFQPEQKKTTRPPETWPTLRSPPESPRYSAMQYGTHLMLTTASRHKKRYQADSFVSKHAEKFGWLRSFQKAHHFNYKIYTCTHILLLLLYYLKTLKCKTNRMIEKISYRTVKYTGCILFLWSRGQIHFTCEAPSLFVSCCWSAAWTSKHRYRFLKASSPPAVSSFSMVSSSGFLSVNSKSQTASTQAGNDNSNHMTWFHNYVYYGYTCVRWHTSIDYLYKLQGRISQTKQWQVCLSKLPTQDLSVVVKQLFSSSIILN